MRTAFLSIATVFSICFSANAQFGALQPNNIGVSYGHRIHDLVYTEGQGYYQDTTDISSTSNYVALHFKQYMRVGDIGSFNAGLSYALDFGAIKYSYKAYNWYDDMVSSKMSVIMNLSVLGEMYFGEDDEPGVFLGLGGCLSFTGDEYLGHAYVGPKMLAGGQFFIGDLLFSLSGDIMYGINRNDIFGEYRDAVLLEKRKCQFGITFAWNIDG
jgi:hypothetical protein